MKKIIFLLLFPLWGLGGLSATFAQSHINIELLGTTYTTPAVQFRVSWSSIPSIDGETHNSKIWLWIDFIKIENNQPSGSWTRATVTNPSPGTVAAETDKGFWLQGATSGSYSQIVTVALNIPANTKFNWCAYSSDCPPNATYNNVTYNSGTYTFKGTPPFKLVSADGLKTQEFNKKSITVAEIGFVPKNFTDATMCPGIGLCPYTGSDEVMDASHFCHLRTTGAKNWETWIKDTRDNKLYRIVLMPDTKWWLAQNVKYAGTSTVAGSAISGCSEDDCGRAYPVNQVWKAWGGSSGSEGNVQGVCPPSWVLPTLADWTTFKNNLGSTDAQRAERIRALNSNCSPITDYFGWANAKMIIEGMVGNIGCQWYGNTTINSRHNALIMEHDNSSCSDAYGCGHLRNDWCVPGTGTADSTHPAIVRCLR